MRLFRLQERLALRLLPSLGLVLKWGEPPRGDLLSSAMAATQGHTGFCMREGPGTGDTPANRTGRQMARHRHEATHAGHSYAMPPALACARDPSLCDAAAAASDGHGSQVDAATLREQASSWGPETSRREHRHKDSVGTKRTKREER